MSFKVHHLNCGTFCPACRPWINGDGRWRDRGTLVCHCLLIETNDGLVLIDTGLGTQDIEQPQQLGKLFLTMAQPRLTQAETALYQVQALGFQPQDVRHIVLTHLDLDHAGGLADFPQATVHVHAAEYEAARHPKWFEKSRYRSNQWQMQNGNATRQLENPGTALSKLNLWHNFRMS